MLRLYFVHDLGESVNGKLVTNSTNRHRRVADCLTQKTWWILSSLMHQYLSESN